MKWSKENKRIKFLQQKLITALSETIEGIYFNGDLTKRIPHNINFCIGGLRRRKYSIIIIIG
jgi:cysteine sulfinate desulfinase/cysteine desulfurase-like protein